MSFLLSAVLPLSITWLVNHSVNHLFSLGMFLSSPTLISFKSTNNQDLKYLFQVLLK